MEEGKDQGVLTIIKCLHVKLLGGVQGTPAGNVIKLSALSIVIKYSSVFTRDVRPTCPR